MSKALMLLMVGVLVAGCSFGNKDGSDDANAVDEPSASEVTDEGDLVEGDYSQAEEVVTLYVKLAKLAAVDPENAATASGYLTEKAWESVEKESNDLNKLIKLARVSTLSNWTYRVGESVFREGQMTVVVHYNHDEGEDTWVYGLVKQGGEWKIDSIKQ